MSESLRWVVGTSFRKTAAPGSDLWVASFFRDASHPGRILPRMVIQDRSEAAVALRGVCESQVTDSPVAARMKGVGRMPEWLGFLLFLVAYFALMRWVLPRFGVPT